MRGEAGPLFRNRPSADRRRSVRRAAFFAAAMTAALPAHAATAHAATAHVATDGPGSPGYGRQLAQEICGECHRVSRDRTPKPPAMAEDTVAPDLTERVRDPGVTEMALRSYLRTSHPVMPNIRLTEEETDDIVAYLMSLKGAPQ
ncbi:c-type cytochrome [Azospirillum sp. sgz302134]